MTRAKYIVCVGAVMLFIALGLRLARSSRAPANAAGFSFVGVPVAAAGSFSFGITNASHLDVDYIALAPQVQSNGVWLEVQPPSVPATTLPARQGGTLTLVVPASSYRGSWRVPVIWGYRPTDVQLFGIQVENFVARLLDPKAMPKGFSTESYTNYSTEITQ